MTIGLRLMLGIVATIAVAFIIAAATQDRGATERIGAIHVKAICKDKCAAYVIF